MSGFHTRREHPSERVQTAMLFKAVHDYNANMKLKRIKNTCRPTMDLLYSSQHSSEFLNEFLSSLFFEHLLQSAAG